MTSDNNVRRRLSYRDVADALRASIVTDRLSQNQRLPAEAQLAQAFGVGRATIRESLRILASEGLIVSMRGRNGGTYVTRPDLGWLSGNIEQALGLMPDLVTVDQLLEARALLEIPASRLAADRANDQQRRRLLASAKDSAEATKLGIEQLASEPAVQSPGSIGSPTVPSRLGFHEALLDASGNDLLAAMAKPVFSILRRRMDRHAVDVDFWVAVEGEHAAIADAIACREPDRAQHKMAAHLETLRSAYPDLLASDMHEIRARAGDKSAREEEE